MNKTRNSVIAENAIVADMAFTRIKGLLGRKDFPQGEALVLKPCNSIHTFFMRFPIDILFVDRHNRVIKTILCLKPFHLTYIYFNATSAIELPTGSLIASSTETGDTIILE